MARQAVHGLGGVGKTRAAVEYAWEHEKDYTALLFVSAPRQPSCGPTWPTWRGCSVSRPPHAVDEQMAAVLRWLEANPGWLLILDNVDTEDAAREVEDCS